MPYTAKSLEDIAKTFDKFAEISHIVAVSTKAINRARVNDAISNTWAEAARILRETTLTTSKGK